MCRYIYIMYYTMGSACAQTDVCTTRRVLFGHISWQGANLGAWKPTVMAQNTSDSDKYLLSNEITPWKC